MEQQTIIKIGDWTIRQEASKKWKVRGPKGNFTMHQIDPTRWRVVSGRFSTNTQTRRKIDACSVEEAAAKSIEIIFRHQLPGAPKWEIGEVLGKWWKSLRCEPMHKATLKRQAGYFIDWCCAYGIYTWTDLIAQKRPMDYVDCLQRKGLKHKTIIHYLEPVRKASRWIETETNGEIRDFYRNYRLPYNIGETMTLDGQPHRSHLSIQDSVKLITYLERHGVNVQINLGITLQSLCGLSLLEVCRLTWDRVDLAKGTITIEEDRRRDPQTRGVKNKYRVRRIPVAGFVWERLKNAYAHIKPAGADLVAGCSDFKAYSKKLSRLMKRFNKNIALPPSDLRNTPATGYGVGNDHPVYKVYWNDATNFITALYATGQGTFRLPTEAEWEYACRAGTSTRFFFGDSLGCLDDCTDCVAGTLSGFRTDYMWYCSNGSSMTHPVRQLIPNAFGLYDMSGNLREWCQDWYQSNFYSTPDATTMSPVCNNSASGYRVVRGGLWDSGAWYCRSAFRLGNTPAYSSGTIGFRIVRNP